MKYKPYCIAAPPYSVVSGGIRVMYALQSWLETKGQIALMNTTFDADFVAIYPEIMHGNDAGASTVVRYILNTPGTMATNGVPGPTSFNLKDKIYVFSEMFNTFGVDEDHILFLPVLNLHLFKDQEKKRTKTCYFVGKGLNLNKHPEDAIEINRANSRDQAHLADVLNRCKRMYCYDDATTMTEIARLCGCPVTVYPGKRGLQDWEKYEPGMNGITWGDDSPEKLDIAEFRKHYKDMILVFESRLEKFIDDTQK